MLGAMPTLGIRFDIDKAGGGSYGFACWKIFWAAIPPAEIGAASLYEGDTAATLNGRENVFCIAVQSLNTGTIEKIKTAMEQNEAFRGICAVPKFIEGTLCSAEPLVDAGRIDAVSELVGDAGTAQAAFEALIKEETAAPKKEDTAVATEVPESNVPLQWSWKNERIITPTNVTMDLLQDSFTAAGHKTALDENGSLFIKDIYPVYLFISKDRNRLTFQANIKTNPKARAANILKFVNTTNEQRIQIKAIYSKDRIVFEYDAWIEGGTFMKTIDASYRSFISNVNAAVQKEKDIDRVFIWS